MKIIFSVDAVHLPLTGIGRYAYELGRRLPQHSRIADVRYFSFGRWISESAFQGMAVSPLPASTVKQTSLAGQLRTVLAGNRLAVRAYHKLSNPWYAYCLRNNSDAIFHSPNYFLPPFGGRSVATVHDLSHLFFPEYHPLARVDYLRRALPETLKRADFLITDAESVRLELIKHYSWPADRVIAVPLGVDPVFQPRSSADASTVVSRYELTSGSYALFVGTIEPRKNLEALISAYELLPMTDRRQYPLVLVGAKGWRSEGIHQRITHGVSAGWLKYLDYVPQRDLPFLYSGARLFLYPSLYEGFGLPVLEAMASGVPVVTSAVSSLPEVAGGAALAVNPHDIDELTQAIVRGLHDEQWRQIAVPLGLERARLLSWEQCVSNTVAVYATLAQRVA